MPIAVHQNKQQDHIHVQSCSCILLQTNALHLKKGFNYKSKLKYVTLRNVSYEIARRLTEVET
jgi:hypothetical protein